MPKRRTVDEESELWAHIDSDDENEDKLGDGGMQAYIANKEEAKEAAEAEEAARQEDACEVLDERAYKELLFADRAWIGTVAGGEGWTFNQLQESFCGRSSGFERKLDHEYYRVLNWRLKMHAMRGRPNLSHSDAQAHSRENKYAALTAFRDSIRQSIKNYGDALAAIGYVEGNAYEHLAYAYADVLPDECAMSMVEVLTKRRKTSGTETDTDEEED